MVVSVTNAANNSNRIISGESATARFSFVTKSPASVARPTTFATGSSCAKPQVSLCGLSRLITNHAMMPIHGFRRMTGTSPMISRRTATSRMGRILFQQAKNVGPSRAHRGLTPQARPGVCARVRIAFQVPRISETPAGLRQTLNGSSTVEMLPSASVALHRRSTPAPSATSSKWPTPGSAWSRRHRLSARAIRLVPFEAMRREVVRNL